MPFHDQHPPGSDGSALDPSVGDRARFPAVEPEQAAAPPSLSPASFGYRRSAGKYRLRAEGGQLHVEPARAAGTTDLRSAAVGPASIFCFADRRIGLLSPIVLDLDGDGIELRRRRKSDARFDMDGDGRADDTGWVAKDDSILVIDRNGDGRITSASELSFLTERQDAVSSLHGLMSLDANRDGAVDASDQRFSELKVWIDRNGDGVSQAGELRSLEEQGIKSLSLDALAVNASVKLGANAIFTSSTFTRTDGSLGTFGDAALAFRPSSNPAPQAAPQAAAELEDVRHASDLASMLRTVGSKLGTAPVSGQPASLSRRSPDRTALPLAAAADQIQAAPSSVGAAGRSAPPASDSDGAGLEYAGLVAGSSARLVQALGAFRTGPRAAFADLSFVQAAEAPLWITIASLPSV